MATLADRQVAPRSMQFAVFAVGLLWVLAVRSGAASAADGISRLVGGEGIRALLESVFRLLLLLTGFAALNWAAFRERGLLTTNALPSRPTTAREWQKGAALGWALLLVAIAPAALLGRMHPQFQTEGRVWGSTILFVATLLVSSLATEVAFRGFLFRRLSDAFGTVVATLLLSVIFAVISTTTVNGTRLGWWVAFASGLLFSMAYLRTHGLWLGWGLRFGWLASMGVLFGLPVGEVSYVGSVVSTDTAGPVWLTGGAYGPEGAFWTLLVLLGGCWALYRLTRDYAWSYTHPVILPGGYPMEAQPPAAHVAMQAATPPPPLIQIQSTTSRAVMAGPKEVRPTGVPAIYEPGESNPVPEPGVSTYTPGESLDPTEKQR